MTTKSPAEVLAEFERGEFTALGRRRDVYRMGSGPTVLVLTEMPGITPSVAEFAQKVASRGFTVSMPHLFGNDGHSASNSAYLRSLVEVCVSRQFTLFATGKASPITSWLNALARHEHKANGGPGVGVIGMCLTGGFALAMMVDPVVVAPVLSQPSLPAALRKNSKSRSDLGISVKDRAAIVERAESGQCVMGMRFTGDKLVPAERFSALRELLGDNFLGTEIDSSPTNEWGYPADAHCVLTEHLGDDPASPTHIALENVLKFCEARLKM